MKQSLENLNIALVHDWMTVMAGGERVLLELSKIFPEAPIYTSVYDPEKMPAFSGKKVIPSFLQKFPLIAKKRELLVPLAPFAFEQFDFSKYDLVISSSSMAAKGIITKPKTIHICYCHTPSRYLWEPQLDPRADAGLFSGLRKKIAHNLRIWDRLAAMRVDHFIANSNYIADRIKKYYRQEAKVIYPPIPVDEFQPVEKSEIGDYYLYVSRLVGYKKCDLVVDAFNQLKLPLVIIGNGPEKSRLVAKANRNIKFLGFISEVEKRDYFAKARAFVFPAEEDFGIVMVEALASGRPLIAYKEGGAAEIVQPGINGEFFNEQSVNSLCGAITAFKQKEYDSIAIKKSAENFSDSRFREDIIKLVEKNLSDNL